MVIFGQNHGAEYTIMGTSIESTSLYRKARKFRNGIPNIQQRSPNIRYPVTVQLIFKRPPKINQKKAPNWEICYVLVLWA